MTIEENTNDKDALTDGSWIHFEEFNNRDEKYLEKQTFKKIQELEQAYKDNCTFL